MAVKAAAINRIYALNVGLHLVACLSPLSYLFPPPASPPAFSFGIYLQKNDRATFAVAIPILFLHPKRLRSQFCACIFLW